jgi:gentisate 1,2-dioxygenase
MNGVVEHYSPSSSSINGITGVKRPLQAEKMLLDPCADSRIYEYTTNANPPLPKIPVLALSAETYQSGPTRIVKFDLKDKLDLDYEATSPNLLASFLRICNGEALETQALATSQSFYVISGSGFTSSEHGDIEWSEGDLFVLPSCKDNVKHSASADTAIYWVTDEPLMRYLGVETCSKKFVPTLFKKERLLAEVEKIAHGPDKMHKNRVGVLLGNKITEKNTKTLTHVLWSLLNVLPAGDNQRPHRHNSVALDLCVSSSGKGVYTLMGPELNEKGWVKNPIRCDWTSGSVFVTPPGWWHSHHNESGEDAWVLPIQDAGLYTHQRTLDIQFSTGDASFHPCL